MLCAAKVCLHNIHWKAAPSALDLARVSAADIGTAAFFLAGLKGITDERFDYNAQEIYGVTTIDVGGAKGGKRSTITVILMVIKHVMKCWAASGSWNKTRGEYIQQS